MLDFSRAAFESSVASSVIALHCSLGSGQQWVRLAEELAGRHQVIAPDISGYGSSALALERPITLAREVDLLSNHFAEARGPIHLIGHSYGGALAFKIATDSPVASRVRSLTLIEPVLPNVLLETGSDRQLHEHFVEVAREVHEGLRNGSPDEALDIFLAFWQGAGPADELSSKARLRLMKYVEKLPFDFRSIFAEQNAAAAAAEIRVPTLLFSGGLSPRLTQRVVGRLASIIPGAETRHLPEAGHMLPISHAGAINPDIARHIAQADALARNAISGR
jgi:pimeloyl-ACP methyl ester carboxylesterase